jgi:hypothetical protein
MSDEPKTYPYADFMWPVTILFDEEKVVKP